MSVKIFSLWEFFTANFTFKQVFIMCCVQMSIIIIKGFKKLWKRMECYWHLLDPWKYFSLDLSLLRSLSWTAGAASSLTAAASWSSAPVEILSSCIPRAAPRAHYPLSLKPDGRSKWNISFSTEWLSALRGINVWPKLLALGRVNVLHLGWGLRINNWVWLINLVNFKDKWG